jgi:hypothetical protein
MSEKDNKNGDVKTDDGLDTFVVDETISSGAVARSGEITGGEDTSLLSPFEEENGDEERSPAFRELAHPKLPELQKENRAKLLMQSPNKLFFYWSIKTNPFRTLNRALGDRTGNYTLVLKLIDLGRDTEEIFPVEAEGSWWFDVEADASYRAEIGFYAPNGPYVRLMFSNVIETPRKSPSPRIAAASEWTVSANAFAKVLNVSGFAQDAFDVAMAGDDLESARHATHTAFSQFIGSDDIDLKGYSPEDLRLALLALASGIDLEALRDHISPALFAMLETNIAVLNAEKANSVLQEHFHISGDEDLEEEHIGAAVFGASLVSFPRLTIRKRGVPKFAPFSSFSVGSR